MFFDPTMKPETETKADPFSLDSLIAWLETKAPNEQYDYGCNGHCLLAQYLTHLGHEQVRIGGWGRFSTSTTSGVFPEVFWRAACGSPSFGEGGCKWRWTFGAALGRARDGAA